MYNFFLSRRFFSFKLFTSSCLYKPFFCSFIFVLLYILDTFCKDLFFFNFELGLESSYRCELWRTVFTLEHDFFLLLPLVFVYFLTFFYITTSIEFLCITFSWVDVFFFLISLQVVYINLFFVHSFLCCCCCISLIHFVRICFSQLWT